MKYKYLIFFITLLLFACQTKEPIQKNIIGSSAIQIWTKQSKVKEVVQFEKSLSNSYQTLEKKISLSKEVFPMIQQYSINNPLIVKRKQTGFLPIYAEYYYSKEDSILRYVSYDWERDRFGNFFKKKDIWLEESKKLENYNNEYEEIKASVIKIFGAPNKDDSAPKLTKSTTDRADYLSRDTIWDNDRFHAQLNMIFESMTYRIRLDFYWK